MKKIFAAFLAAFMLFTSSVALAGARLNVKLGPSSSIKCVDGALSVKLTVRNEGDLTGTLLGIKVNRVTVYADGAYWWEARDRDLGEMAYTLKPGETKEITVTFRDEEISRFDGKMKLTWKREILFRNE